MQTLSIKPIALPELIATEYELHRMHGLLRRLYGAQLPAIELIYYLYFLQGQNKLAALISENEELNTSQLLYCVNPDKDDAITESFNSLIAEVKKSVPQDDEMQDPQPQLLLSTENDFIRHLSSFEKDKLVHHLFCLLGLGKLQEFITPQNLSFYTQLLGILSDNNPALHTFLSCLESTISENDLSTDSLSTNENVVEEVAFSSFDGSNNNELSFNEIKNFSALKSWLMSLEKETASHRKTELNRFRSEGLKGFVFNETKALEVLKSSSETPFIIIAVLFLFSDKPNIQSFLEQEEGVAIQMEVLDNVKKQMDIEIADWITHTRLLVNIVPQKGLNTETLERFDIIINMLRGTPPDIRAELFINKDFIEKCKQSFVGNWRNAETVVLTWAEKVLSIMSFDYGCIFSLGLLPLLTEGYLKTMRSSDVSPLSARLIEALNSAQYIPISILLLLTPVMSREQKVAYLWKAFSTRSYGSIQFTNSLDSLQIISSVLDNDFSDINWLQNHDMSIFRYARCITSELLAKMSPSQQVDFVVGVGVIGWLDGNVAYLRKMDSFEYHKIMIQALSINALYFLRRVLTRCKVNPYSDAHITYTMETGRTTQKFCIDIEDLLKELTTLVQQEFQFRSSQKSDSPLQTAVTSNASARASSATISVAEASVISDDFNHPWFMFTKNEKTPKLADAFHALEKECMTGLTPRTLLLCEAKTLILSLNVIGDTLGYNVQTNPISNIDVSACVDFLNSLIKLHNKMKENYENAPKGWTLTGNSEQRKCQILMDIILSIKNSWTMIKTNTTEKNSNWIYSLKKDRELFQQFNSVYLLGNEKAPSAPRQTADFSSSSVMYAHAVVLAPCDAVPVGKLTG